MDRPVKDPLIGSTLDDRFQLLERIGQGATSSVYKASDLSADNLVAIKLLHAHLCSDGNLVSRFEREAQAAKILVHPNIVAVNEYAVAANGTPYLVMECVNGMSLQQKLTADSWLPLKTALPIFTQICAALNVAHQAGIVHRDLKPGNIMLTQQADGTTLVKILDFGCAMLVPMLSDTVLKVTQTGEMLGSLLYMSPEQCLDQDVDARSDIYSLACVLYETVTGKPPLSARTAFETMNKQISITPDGLARARPDLTFPFDLEKVIFKAMAKSPSKRYQNVVDLLDELQKISEGKAITHAVKVTQTMPTVRAQKQQSITVANLWNKYWSIVCVIWTLVSLATYPILMGVSIILWFFMMLKEYEDAGKTSIAIETKSLETQLDEQSDGNQLAHKIAHLAPLAKIDIFVHEARKSFTYSSGDVLISMTISTDKINMQEVIVRPVFQKSFYWDNICGVSQMAKESSDSMEVPAYITKSTDSNWNVIVIKANQAVIVETVSTDTPQDADVATELEELNFEA